MKSKKNKKLRKKDFIPAPNNKDLELLHYPDCVHLLERCGCNILRINECTGNGCSFRQSEREREVSNNKWLDILNELSNEKQCKIASQYYNGKTPWKVCDKKG